MLGFVLLAFGVICLQGLGLEVGGWFPRALLVCVSLPLYEVDTLAVLSPSVPEDLFDLVFTFFVGRRHRHRVVSGPIAGM